MYSCYSKISGNFMMRMASMHAHKKMHKYPLQWKFSNFRGIFVKIPTKWINTSVTWRKAK